MCCRRPGNGLGYIAVAVGVLILLAMVLPTWFWWIVCAASFVTGGLLLLRR